MKLRDYIQSLNVMAMIYMFASAVLPAMLIVMTALLGFMGAVALPPEAIAMIFLVVLPVHAFLLRVDDQTKGAEGITMGLIKSTSSVVKRVFPDEFLGNLGRRLESTNILLSAEEYVSVSLLIVVGACIGVGLLNLIFAMPLFPLLLVFSALLTFMVLVIGVPYYLTQRRAAELEQVLPDALRHMASTLRAGVSIDGAMEEVEKSKYGALSREFERAVAEVRRGRAVNDALLAVARRSNSPIYERGFHLITEGIERGASIADVLDAVSADVREVHSIQRERRASTMQQVLFLMVVALFATPFIVGLTVAIGRGFAGSGGEIGSIAAAYITIQAFICALAVGIIRYGQMRKGFMFIVPFVVLTLGIFYASRFMLGFFVGL